ncbi:hypothetical protein ACJMK2_030553 [Sinanodonta woodiana]|uniref:Uncharacterized protein n=1 Tax=Sinanodonta woodiana TaxID=1069815 RepID=A0ABD3WW19_SINWO
MMKRLLASILLCVSIVISHGITKSTEHLVYLPEAANMDKTRTAGNTKCRSQSECGYHDGVNYSWCYTDYSDNWDYCCTGECTTEGATFLWCQSGLQAQYCGNTNTKDVNGRKCLGTHTCGTHMEDIYSPFADYYWCYVDMNANWGYCCSPFSNCGKHGESYNWCNTSRSSDSNSWDYCNIN